MDKQQLNNEFMSITSESHPGLTFEEYRDSCVFLIFYHYLCLRFQDGLEEQYKPGAMVRLAVRGKLQMPAFLKFMEQASPFIHMAGSRFDLTELSFYQKLLHVHQLEKQKSYARFFRKLIKKIEAWDSNDLLLQLYDELFEKLLAEFARMKKDSYISESLIQLYRLLYEHSGNPIRKVFLPDFQYGILLNTMLNDTKEANITGFEEREIFLEILSILCYMKGIPEEDIHLFSRKEWMEQVEYLNYFDAVTILMPEGAEPGNYVMNVPEWHPVRQFMFTGTKGEFPLLLSALPMLSDHGVMAAVMPSALLYREGKEAQIRRYIVEEAACLELVMLLPDHIFHSTGQNEVMLFFRNQRKNKDIMFFDCSEMDHFGEDEAVLINEAWEERKNIPGFCASIDQEMIRKNDYNLNLPRYITKSVKMTEVDLKEKLRRIAEIDQELLEINQKIAMYRRDLELN